MPRKKHVAVVVSIVSDWNGYVLGGGRGVRQTIRKVAKDPMLIIAMVGVVARGW